MLAILSWLKTHHKYAQISLVCSGYKDETNKLYRLNEFSDEQLIQRYKTGLYLGKMIYHMRIMFGNSLVVKTH